MASPPSFTVATYNLLADSYIDYAKDYTDVDPAVLNPRHRWPRLIKRVRELDADVLCLQEVEPGFFAELEQALLSAGYIHRWRARAPCKPAGCALFLKSSLVLEKSCSQHFEAGQVLKDKATHIAQHAVIDCVGGYKLLLVNTHLPPDKPEKPIEERFGGKQAEELLTFLRERREAFGYPSIICGDLNATPESDVVKRFLDAEYHELHDRHAPTYGRGRGGPRKLDHIFHSEGLRAEAFPTPTMNLERVPPNETEPSDHLPLVARFTFSR